jgi:hypothetical protein
MLFSLVADPPRHSLGHGGVLKFSEFLLFVAEPDREIPALHVRGRSPERAELLLHVGDLALTGGDVVRDYSGGIRRRSLGLVLGLRDEWVFEKAVAAEGDASAGSDRSRRQRG